MVALFRPVLESEGAELVHYKADHGITLSVNQAEKPEKLSYAASLSDASQAHSALQRKGIIILLRTAKNT